MPHEANIGRQPNVTGAPLFDPRQGPRDIPQESEIDLLGIISRMLAGEDEQAFQPGGRSTYAPAGAVSTITNPDANIPTIQADPTPVKVRPPGFDDQRRGENLAIAAQTNVEDPRNVSTFRPSQEVPVDVNEPAPFAEELLQQQQQASLQDYNPDVERVSGVPRLPVSSEVLQAPSMPIAPPAQSNRELEQALFEIIQRASAPPGRLRGYTGAT